MQGSKTRPAKDLKTKGQSTESPGLPLSYMPRLRIEQVNNTKMPMDADTKKPNKNAYC